MRHPASRSALAVALALGTSLTGLPALAQHAAAPMPDGVTHFTLPNGLETVVIQDERAPVVVQMVWYKIGAADEVPGKSGIAHYLEHLMFKAPIRWSRRAVQDGDRERRQRQRLHIVGFHGLFPAHRQRPPAPW